MKKTYAFLLAGLALMSCNKQLEPAEEPQAKPGTPMTLTATIGGPQTKLGFTEEENVLKGTWSANEKISVITLETSGSSKKIKTMDIFTVGEDAEGQRKATFSGTLSAGATEDIRIIYPALDSEYERDSYPKGTFYGTPKLPGDDSYAEWSYFDNRLIGKAKVGSERLQIQATVSRQRGNGNFDHLPGVTMLDGSAKVSADGTLEVELKPLSSVVKVVFTLPSRYPDQSGDYVSNVEIRARKGINSNNEPILYCFTDEYYYFNNGIGFYSEFTNNTRYACARLRVKKTDGIYEYVFEGNTYTVYIPIIPGEGAIWGPSGAKQLAVRLWGLGNFDVTKVITLEKDTILEGGKIYTLKVDISDYNTIHH